MAYKLKTCSRPVIRRNLGYSRQPRSPEPSGFDETSAGSSRIAILTQSAHANRFPLRSKTLWYIALKLPLGTAETAGLCPERGSARDKASRSGMRENVLLGPAGEIQLSPGREELEAGLG